MSASPASDVVVVFVSPYFSENARKTIEAVAAVPGVRLGVVSQEPLEVLPEELRRLVAAHWRVEDSLRTEQIVQAARGLAERLGPLHRIIGAIEQIQVQLGEAREQLGVDGMRAAEARNFREKSRMKALLRDAGLPVARARIVASEDEAVRFAGEVGYPVVVKPNAGAASQATVRVDGPEALRGAVEAATKVVGADGTVLLEEFVTGEEHSFDAFLVDGRMVFHSVTDYWPTPIEAMQNPWIQWTVLLPREVDGPRYDVIREVGPRALEVLGLRTGMCHMEWFRRADGSVVISEVAARPPGAQITTLISRANDFDCLLEWARLMIHGEFRVPPERKYAAGAAFLRAQGHGSRIVALRGIEEAQREVGHLVTDGRLPEIGKGPAPSYEGDGWVVMRHPETQVVKHALERLVSTVRVELGD